MARLVTSLKGVGMLYKVWTRRSFADEEDRVGVIQASSLEQAVEKFLYWEQRIAGSGDYVRVGEPTVSIGEKALWADIDILFRDLDGAEGTDSYVVSPVGSDVLMFLVQDWNLVFA